jgi:hypothetical protein
MNKNITKSFLLTMVMVTNVLLSQKIDYNNFDVMLASKILFEKMNYFRDTITQTGYGAPFDSVFFETKNNKSLRKLYWSDNVYKLISEPNCSENIRRNELFHVDRQEWWDDETNRDKFLDDVYAFVPKPAYKCNQLTYSENCGFTTAKFETYQDLADHIILAWEDSYFHRCLQRSGLYSSVSIGQGCKIRTASACCVKNVNGVTWFFINFIH